MTNSAKKEAIDGMLDTGVRPVRGEVGDYRQ